MILRDPDLGSIVPSYYHVVSSGIPKWYLNQLLQLHSVSWKRNKERPLSLRNLLEIKLLYNL